MSWRRVPWPAIAAIAAVLAVGATSIGELGRRVEHDVSDLAARLLRHPVESDVVIVGIDAQSFAELDRWPWPRRYHAQLIDKIAEARPRRLFLDIDFSTRSNPEDDARLVEAFRRWRGAPILLPAFFQQATSDDAARSFTQPMEPLRPYAALASVNLLPDADGLVRRMQLGWPRGDDILPSLPVALADANEATGELRLDWSIDPEASFEYVSYADVLANRVAAEHFADKLVLVGATAIELGDNVSVPNWRSLPGVVALAVAWESLRAGGHDAVAAPVVWALLAGWTAVLGFLFCRLSWRRSLGVAAGGILAVAGAAVWLYAVPRVVFPIVPFALAAALCYLLSMLRSLEGESFRALAYAIGIRKRDALLRSIVQSSTDAIICLDAEGRILTANPAASALFGCPHSVLCRTSVLDYIPGLFDGATRPLETLIGAVTEWEALSPAGDAAFPVDVRVSPILPRERGLFTAIVRDISERKAQQEQLRFQATHDPLTTLPNRPALAAHLDAALVRAGGGAVALLMIDLNRFKEVNDTLGHNIGDYVLYEVARRLASVVGARGFIARIGGDEFALVVEQANEPAALAALSRELVACLEEPVETCGISIDVGLSIGIARFPEHADDAETLLKRADIAMYVAKKSRSGFEFYDAASDRHSVRRLTIATRLRKAIANDELTLQYQPQVNLKSGRAEGAEALLRWDDMTLGRVVPDEFIGLAETTDLILPLTEWTLTTALRQLAQWRAQGLELRVAVNLSARMLQDCGFPRRIEALIREAAVPPGSVELEITESAMMFDPERALNVVRALSELDVLISIDDFGTGYSSLAYLRDLPVHAVKLDKSFVMNLGTEGDDRVIVESTVHMAHALGLEIIAEGVESDAIATELARLGYDYGQGYWYSPALLPGALAAWVRQFNSGPAAYGTRAIAAR